MIPSSIEFSIAEDEYLPAVPSANGTPATERETFGDDYVAKLVFRWPTHVELRQTIPVRCTQRLQAAGSLDPSGETMPTYSFAMAMSYFEVLGKDAKGVKKLPEWCSEDAPYSAKNEAAIMRAYQRLREELGAAKKDSADAGATS